MFDLQGDYWETLARNFDELSAICCTTNMIVDSKNELVMGAGIAKDFKKHFSNLPRIWGYRVRKQGRNLDGFMVTPWPPVYQRPHGPYLVAFPTKFHWKEKSHKGLILSSVTHLKNTADIMGWTMILLPRPGCANGGLDWEKDVKPILKPLLDNRFYVISKGENS